MDGDALTNDPVEAPAPPGEGVRRTKQLREELLAKLPQLAYSTWTVKDDFRLDEELSGVIKSGADALLGPLERVAPEHLR